MRFFFQSSVRIFLHHCIIANNGQQYLRWDHNHLSHPDNLIWKAIRRSKNFGSIRNFDPEECWETLYFDPDKNYGKKSYQEMIRSLELVIRNEI